MKMLLLVLGYAAALSILACVVLVIRKHAVLRKAQRFEGLVVNHIARHGSKGATCALKIAYQEQRGVPHEFATSSSSNPPARRVGAKITVFHHPDGSDPDVLIFEHLYLGYWIWFCFAGCVAGCLAAPHFLRKLYL